MSGVSPDIHRSLLEDLSDGVLAVDFDGRIQVANPAFCRMFDLDHMEIVGRAFGEAFVTLEGFDAFTEAVFDAIMERGTGARRIVGVMVGGEQRSLSVATSCLTVAGEDGAAPAAVIAVVSDITEVRELRESELRMAKVIETQLGELQGAYRDLEARNEAISAMRKRVRLGGGVAGAFVALLFLAIGGWYVRPLDLLRTAAAPDADMAAVDGAAPPTMAAAPQLLRSTLSLRGQLAPGQVEEVVSPVDGHVSALRAAQGQRVAAGDTLVVFDSAPLAVAYRRAEIASIKAQERLAKLENWEDSDEMLGAHVDLRRARGALADAERKLERVALLLEQGIVPASEQEAAERALENQRESLQAAERKLVAVTAQGGEDTLRVARLEADTAREQLRTAETKLELTTISAPLAGIVTVATGEGGKPLARGRAVTEGELLMSIADLSRLAVETSIDEVDVRKIQAGQPALISGPGFPGLKISGKVERVSSQARGGSRGGPQFEIVVALDPLSEAAQERVRVGMSAHITVVVYERRAALVVPIGAVQRGGGGEPWLQVRDPATGAIERRAVVLGITTVDSVEVIEGLEAGEEFVVLPGGGGFGASGMGAVGMSAGFDR